MATALAAAQRIAYEVPHAAMVQTMPDASRSRFRRAELELALGDPTVAKFTWYTRYVENWRESNPVAATQRDSIAVRRDARLREARGRS